MRTIALLAGFSVALALVSLAPFAAAASSPPCSDLTDPACPDTVCQDKNGNRRYDPGECTHVPTLCDYMSDCCGGPGGGLWCPDRA